MQAEALTRMQAPVLHLRLVRFKVSCKNLSARFILVSYPDLGTRLGSYIIPKLQLIFVHVPYFFDKMPRLLFFCCSFLCGYYSRVVFISSENLHGHQQQLDKVCTSNTVTTLKHCL